MVAEVLHDRRRRTGLLEDGERQAGQARGFQAEDGPGLAQADLGDEELDAIAPNR